MHHIDWTQLLAGATALGIIGHAVNTFPTPVNRYGQWLIGLLQYIVGQRIAAFNTLKGNATVATAIPAAVSKAANAVAVAVQEESKKQEG